MRLMEFRSSIKRVALAALALCSVSVYATQSETFWTHLWPATGVGTTLGKVVRADASGNVYVAATTEGDGGRRQVLAHRGRLVGKPSPGGPGEEFWISRVSIASALL